MIYLCSDVLKLMDIDKVKKEEKGVKKEKEELKEGQVFWVVLILQIYNGWCIIGIKIMFLKLKRNK